MATLLRIHIPDQTHYHPKLELIVEILFFFFLKSRSPPDITGECSNRFTEHLI